jgi:NADPH:quinone reductase-like Zn-dependent oxidoreductase
MKAVALARFGGPDELKLQTLPVPEISPNEVLIRVDFAGVGVWDPFEREGGYAEMLGLDSRFPYVLGSEGAGLVAAVGAGVAAFEIGDRVYAAGFLNPKGGFYAEYVAVNAALVARVPAGLSTSQAGAMSGAALTALRGLDDTLKLQQGETVMVFGASGGVGHMAVQLAKRMGARVFAVASGDDGVELVRRLGADAVVNGRTEDVLTAASAFSTAGLDAALFTAGGDVAEVALRAMRAGGRVAYPSGVQPEPTGGPSVQALRYFGSPDADILARLHHLVGSGPFQVHIARTFPLAAVGDAHRALADHYLGKLALQVV